jgi:starch synthase (maltosyl-transferring)
MRQPEKMIIYNLFPLLAGRAGQWEDHFRRAAEMGFNWIFVNPIQEPGFSGSLYSIKDYFRINPLFVEEDSSLSPEEQIKEANRQAEKHGLKMMIDLVINHCAVDSELIVEHPEWFEWRKKKKVANPFALENGKKVVWGDLAKFDHRNTKDKEGLFRFFLSVVVYLIDLGFHGFRCDAAYQLPKSLWERLIRETRAKYPDTIFFAETLGCTSDQTRKTASAGFDYIFNSSKWWDFRGSWLMEQYNLTRDIAPSISFPESHDTVRLNEELNGNINGLKQRYLFTALFSAGILMPAGFEFGFRKRMHVVKSRPDDWEETDIDMSSFIEKVNLIKEKYTVFHEESPAEILQCDNPHILLFWKASTHSQDEALMILNKDIYHNQSFHTERLCDLMQSKAQLFDVSPEHAMEYIPEPFSYDLRPGQGIVLVTARDAVSED